MKYLAILLLFSCVAVGTDPPKLGWKKIGEETFSLDAMQHKEFGLPQGRLAFKFKAEEAIYTGVATSQQYAPFRSGKYLELAEFNKFHCVKTDLIEGTQQCNVPISGAVLAIRDKRGPITKMAGGYSLLHPLKGSTALADKASKANKVTVTLFQWTCIENCPAPKR